MGVFSYNNYRAKAEQEEKIAIEKDKEKIFKESMRELYINGVSVAADAEKIGDAYLKAWRDSIFEDSGAKIDGKSYKDFNKALEAQTEVFTKNDSLKKLTEDFKEVTLKFNLMKKAKTSKTADQFDIVKSYYDKLTTFVNTAQSPSGNYRSFTSSYSTTKTEYITAMKALHPEASSDK